MVEFIFKRSGSCSKGCLFLFILMLMSVTANSQEPAVGFTTTPMGVVEGMLDMGKVGPGDYVIDLGSGDGRILISAARRGAVGHGVEIDSALIDTSRYLAESEGVDGRISFVAEDFFETDVSVASVVTLYVMESTNIKLRDKLLTTLEPGSRVISHRYKMGGWVPDESAEVDFRMIYMWIVPADFEGTWNWEMDDQPIELHISQTYQKVTGAQILTSEENSYRVEKPSIHGKTITFSLKTEEQEKAFQFHGSIKGDTITGVVHTTILGEEKVLPWEARR